MGVKKRVLVVSPDGLSTQAIQEATKNWPVLETIVCSSIEGARSYLKESDVHLIFCQNQLINGTYLDLMNMLRSIARDVPVILVVAEEDREFASGEALQHGVFDIVASPCTKQDLQWMIIRTIQHLKAREASFRGKASYMAG